MTPARPARRGCKALPDRPGPCLRFPAGGPAEHASPRRGKGGPTLPAPATVADLLQRIGLDTRKVAVERNLEIVPRSTYAATALAAGDQLEIVHFIGGG